MSYVFVKVFCAVYENFSQMSFSPVVVHVTFILVIESNGYVDRVTE